MDSQAKDSSRSAKWAKHGYLRPHRTFTISWVEPDNLAFCGSCRMDSLMCNRNARADDLVRMILTWQETVQPVCQIVPLDGTEIAWNGSSRQLGHLVDVPPRSILGSSKCSLRASRLNHRAVRLTDSRTVSSIPARTASGSDGNAFSISASTSDRAMSDGSRQGAFSVAVEGREGADWCSSVH